MDKVIAEPTREFEEDMAYPQYHYKYDNVTITTRTWVKLQEYVLDDMNNSNVPKHIHVAEHHENILKGIVPFGMKIVRVADAQ